jgi:excisionase family DNA binding protein
MSETYLTTADVAARLGLSKSTVGRMCQDGTLECYQVGHRRGTYRVTERQLAAFLERRLKKAAGPRPLEMAAAGPRVIRQVNPENIRPLAERRRAGARASRKGGSNGA